MFLVWGVAWARRALQASQVAQTCVAPRPVCRHTEEVRIWRNSPGHVLISKDLYANFALGSSFLSGEDRGAGLQNAPVGRQQLMVAIRPRIRAISSLGAVPRGCPALRQEVCGRVHLRSQGDHPKAGTDADQGLRMTARPGNVFKNRFQAQLSFPSGPSS